MKFDMDQFLNQVYDKLEADSKKISEKVRSVKTAKLTKTESSAENPSDTLEQFLGEISSVLIRGYDVITDAAKPIAQKTEDGLRNASRFPYQRAGMPYGDSEEGRQRWTNEKKEALKTQANKTGTKILNSLNREAGKAKTFAAEKIHKKMEKTDKGN